MLLGPWDSGHSHSYLESCSSPAHRAAYPLPSSGMPTFLSSSLGSVVQSQLRCKVHLWEMKGIIGKDEAREPSEKPSLIEYTYVIVQTHKYTNAQAPSHSHQYTIMLAPTTQIYTYTYRHALSCMCINSCAHNSTQVHKLVHMSMHTASIVFEALDPVDWQPPLFQHFSSPSSAQMLHSPGEMDMAASSTTFTGPARKCPAVGLISVVFNLMMFCICQQMSPH